MTVKPLGYERFLERLNEMNHDTAAEDKYIDMALQLAHGKPITFSNWNDPVVQRVIDRCLRKHYTVRIRYQEEQMRSEGWYELATDGRKVTDFGSTDELPPPLQ